jgi:hypothetical protein
MNLKFLLPCLFLACLVGCGGESTSSVTSGASQSQIDEYNRLIEEEAARAGNQAEKKDI